MSQHEFEQYPELAEMMQEYASFNQFSSWQGFTDALNNALKTARIRAWNQAIKARDNQLATRFPMQCAFLSRTNVEPPEVPDE